MKKATIVTVLACTFLATGCSFGGQELISEDQLKQSADQLKQSATDQLTKLTENTQLEQTLMGLTNLSQEKVDQWMTDLVTDPIIQQASAQLGPDVVQQVIQEMVENNSGVLDAVAVTLIRQELEQLLQGN